MRRAAAALTLLLAAASGAVAQPEVLAEAGRVVVVPFPVPSSGASPLWELPEGWQTFALPEAPEGAPALLLSVAVPRGAPEGRYRLALHAAGDRAERWVRVRPRVAVSVEAVAVPAFLEAGQAGRVVFRVRNEGNVATRVALAASATPCLAWPEAPDLALALGADTLVAVAVQAPPGEGVSRARLRLRARPDGGAEVSARADLRLLPRIGPVGRVPQARFVALAAALQSSEGGTAEVALDALVPLRTDSSLVAFASLRHTPRLVTAYARRDVLLAGVQGRTFRARAGTDIFALSPLAGAYRWGTGAAASLVLGATEASATVRAVAEGATEAGGRLSRRVGASTLSANAFGRMGAAAGGALTARLEVPRSRWGTLDAEAGAGGVEVWAPSYRLQWGRVAGRLAATAGLSHVASDHPGPERGDRLRGATLSYRLSTRVRLRLSAQERSDVLLAGLRQWRRAEATLRDTWRRERGTLASSVGIAAVSRGGAFATRSGMVGTADASYRQGGARLGVRLEAGGAWASPEAGPRPVLDGTVLAGWSRGGTVASWTVSGTLGDDLASPGGLGWGTRLELRHQRGELDVRASAGVGQAPPLVAGPAAVGRLADVRVTARVPVRGVALVGDAIVQRVGGQARSSVRLGVEVALGGRGPLRLRPDLVRGRLVDPETGAGLPDVLVSLGNRVTVTDAEGRFAFDRPVPGVHALQVDRLSLGAEVSPLVPLPLAVTVPEAGAVPEVVVPVAARRGLTGTVRLARLVGGLGGIPADTLREAPLAGAVVVAERGALRHEAVTDAEGRFAFADLAFGNWTLRVVAGGPEGAVSAPLRLQTGSVAELLVVRPARRVRMVAAPPVPSAAGGG